MLTRFKSENHFSPRLNQKSSYYEMDFGTLSSVLRFIKELLICALKAHTGGVMERRLRRSASAARLYMDYNKPYLQVRSKQQRAFPTSYFRVESVPVLLFLTASLLLLPLVLPPLPPPPFLLLLLPMGMLLLLMILAFMPSDVREVASSYL
uniref:ARGOS-like protein n=1 Tax=Ananas comosus var. bracteatus TaxID=296719 RepID=A0A6V7Q739_ANACO|nr:unnamed protein product [Ananas comosus var. bracteatus]